MADGGSDAYGDDEAVTDERHRQHDVTETDSELLASGSGEMEAVPDESKPPILQQSNLMQLLADAITYRSPLKDINVILSCGAKVNAAVKRGLRPLHYAVYVDYVECVQLLLDCGADVNATDEIGYTPIHLCARKGNIESMKILIKAGATVDFMSGDAAVEENSRALGYLTVEPVNLAIENNHVECLKLLLERGAKPDHKYFMGYEINLVPLDHLECLKLLLDYGADPNVFNRCGQTPLMKACRQQNLPAARLLLSRGAKLDLQSPPRFEQKTALHFAVASGNAALVHVLLRHGASPKRPAEYKFSALQSAVLCDRPDMCELLLKRGADVDERSDEQATALMLACATRGLSKQRELVELLLDKGANANANSGYVTYTSPAYLSPLVEHLRHMEDDVDAEVVRLLIEHGAQVHFRGAATNVRVMDPFGVLNYLSHVTERDDVFGLLLGNATAFSCDDIRTSRHLSGAHKVQLLKLASVPLELKRIVRHTLRQILCPRLHSRVKGLPVPDCVKNFLLTG